MFFLITRSLFFSILLCNRAYAIDKPANEVFKKWVSSQNIISDINLSNISEYICPNFFNEFKTRYNNNIQVLNALRPFLSSLTGEDIDNVGQTCNPIFINNLRTLYTLIENNIPGLFDFFKQHQFGQENHLKQDEEATVGFTIDQYNTLVSLFFVNHEQSMQLEYACAFALANRFFEFCFNPATYLQFSRMIREKKEHPYARLLYAIMWQTLSGNGWQDWHENSLLLLQKKALAGDRIIYIAGGSDIYQLIKAGIYNITIIDPQLPSQPDYYADQWDWILAGNSPELQADIGDHIIFNFDNKKVTNKRVKFTRYEEKFQAQVASGEIIELNYSITEWAIFENNIQVGTCIFDRRCCNQDDFIIKPNQTLLMSLNELHFVSIPPSLGGWGIDVAQFPQNLEIVIKQLRKPVTKDMLCNIRFTSLLNGAYLRYIALGSCAN